MSPLNRREVLGLLSAAAGAAAPVTGKTPDLEAIVAEHDKRVESNLAAQNVQSAGPGYGGFRSPVGLFPAGSAAGAIQNYMAAYLQPLSRFHGNHLLVERIRLAARFLEGIQHPDGSIDLLETNFDSTPDTAFVVHPICSAACLAKRGHHDELVAALAPFLKKSAGLLAVGGIHTPNHRWVVSSALAQVNEVFPDPRYVRRIDQWLAEGIDIDADGQYTERSTSVYNAVVDRALVVMAVKLGRPQLLDPVRKNLQSMMYLLHPNFEVVTEISHRQDRAQIAGMNRYWFPLRYLAAKDQQGQFLAIANHLTPTYASLSDLMEYPETGGPLPAVAQPPSDFEKEMPLVGVVRYRRGDLSATILNNDANFFSLRKGNSIIEAVRFATSFFGKGQFVASNYSKAGGSWLLEQHLEAPYYQPLDPPQKVTPQTWSALRGQRPTSQVCHLHQRCEIAETRTGFKVRVRSDGTAGVPGALEIHLRDGGELTGCERSGDGIYFLTSGSASYRAGERQIRFGPGLHQHSYVEIRGALPKQAGPSVYLTGFTPFDHTVEFECG